MGTITCSRCKATTEADSIEEGRHKVDHGIGLHKGKPCEDGKAELFFTGKQKTQKSEKGDEKRSDRHEEKRTSFKKVIDKSKDLFRKE